MLSTDNVFAAADTCMTRDSASLIAEAYPSVPITRKLRGRETLLAIDHAREVPGHEPRFGWNDEVARSPGA